jgi:hypothetical protein
MSMLREAARALYIFFMEETCFRRMGEGGREGVQG